MNCEICIFCFTTCFWFFPSDFCFLFFLSCLLLVYLNIFYDFFIIYQSINYTNMIFFYHLTQELKYSSLIFHSKLIDLFVFLGPPLCPVYYTCQYISSNSFMGVLIKRRKYFTFPTCLWDSSFLFENLNFNLVLFICRISSRVPFVYQKCILLVLIYLKMSLFYLQFEGCFHWIKNSVLIAFYFFQYFRDDIPLF